jgi:hypothetical protein
MTSGIHQTSRRGMAVFIVIMVSAVIAVFTTIVIYQTRGSAELVEEKQDKAQAQYLAKGAHNHFLLKFKLLPTELYDAVSYAVGKNPYFDFSIPVTGVTGTTFTPDTGVDPDFGPMFYTGVNTQVTVPDPTGAKRFKIDRAIDKELIFTNPKIGLTPNVTLDGVPSATKDVMAYLLNHYILDIATDYPYPTSGVGVVVVNSDPHTEVAQFGKKDSDAEATNFSWRDPFNGSYIVRSLKILGIGGSASADAGKKYLSDTVLLTTEASISRDHQVSLISKDAGGQLKQLLVQKRVLTNIKSTDTFPELVETLEDNPTRDARASGSRTEVSTGVYFVTRKSK